MSSGGGTTQTQKTELPPWLENAAQQNLARAEYVSKLGYVPQYGVDVAGFSPMQTSAMQNTANAASAFGLGAPTDVMAGMPATTTDNLGFTGYSSGAMFDNYLSNLAAQRPAQYGAMQAQFVDPLSGEVGVDFGSGGQVTVNEDALNNMSVPVQTGGGTEYVAGNAFDPAKMSLGMENFLLGASLFGDNYPALAPLGFLAKGVSAITTPMIEARMDAMQDNSDRVYNDSTVSGINVGSDENGNLYTYSPSTWDNGSSGSSFDSSGQWSGGDFSAPSWGADGNDWDNW